MGFSSQFRGFLKRNFIIKCRNKTQTLTEIIMIVLVLVVLIFFDIFFKARKFDVAKYDPVSIGQEFVSLKLLMMPNTSQVHKLGDYLRRENAKIDQITYFDNKTEMEDFYLKEGTDLTFGIEFYAKNIFTYKIYTKWQDELFNDTSVMLTADSRECRIRNMTTFNFYENCAGNKLVYNGFTFLQYHLNFNIIKVTPPG
jgi:hypothetical protein